MGTVIGIHASTRIWQTQPHKHAWQHCRRIYCAPYRALPRPWDAVGRLTQVVPLNGRVLRVLGLRHGQNLTGAVIEGLVPLAGCGRVAAPQIAEANCERSMPELGLDSRHVAVDRAWNQAVGSVFLPLLKGLTAS